ncbi:LegC family aminotransferase [Halomonas sp. KM-1]|uniref:LegC family aminotransferase n=1 Tax=Halomonas sp. KM-1 TaxID=590061 RepID=UPI000288EBCF|nr:LegC family aminotransferase [Halomonas sp. KM-1]
MFSTLIEFIRDHYRTQDFIPLHAPVFRGNEKNYVAETIDSTFVSSVGSFVDRFEHDMAAYTGSPRAVATVNGTAALHVALRLVGAERGDYILTQPLTFVATCNAIAYCGAMPIFIDVDRSTLSLSPKSLSAWLEENAYLDEHGCCRRLDNQGVIRACLPMHTFGHPADLNGLVHVCNDWGIALVEDAAESLGSTYQGQHTGTFGIIGVLSFNGNKVITTGGGGMVLADEKIASRAKHLTTTAKKPHTYEYVHDEVGYNYRLPNINAALGCAQLEQLDAFINEKRQLANEYARCLSGSELSFITEPAGCRSNYWLNAVICADRQQRDELLSVTNGKGVMTRPIWQLMNRLPMYANASTGELTNSLWLEERVVNLPSGIRLNGP